MKRAVPFVVIVADRARHRGHQHPPADRAVRPVRRLRPVAATCVYAWRKAKGQPVSVISTSTDEPDERGLHKLMAVCARRRIVLHSLHEPISLALLLIPYGRRR